MPIDERAYKYDLSEEHLELIRGYDLNDGDLIYFAKIYPNLKSISLTPEFSDEGISHLKLFQKLEAVSIDIGYSLSEVAAIEIAKLPHLKELILNNFDDLSIQFFEVLSKSKILKVLNLLNDDYVLDAYLEYIAKICTLEALYINGSDKITPKGIQHLASLTKLKELCLGFVSGINVQSLFSLSSLKELKVLMLYKTGVDDRDLEVISSFKSLEKLDLRNCRDFTLKGLLALKSLNHLQELDLTHCYQLSEEDINTFKIQSSSINLSIVSPNKF